MASNRCVKAMGEAPSGLRVNAPKGLARGVITPEGGEFGGGLITGVSLVTRGEALGHGYWLDSEFIDQVHAAGLESENGLKARFTHPGLSSDGLGTTLGRWKNFKKIGSKQVYADLHLHASAHNAPDGDLAQYVMDLAAEDPELFGASIVFWLDEAATKAFEIEHEDDEGRFKSPDRENTHNYPHARLERLSGADIVDEPAANPAGMFSARGNELPAAAEHALAYAIGLRDDAPEEMLLGVHPERLKKFWEGFVARHGVTLRHGCDEHWWSEWGGAAAQTETPVIHIPELETESDNSNQTLNRERAVKRAEMLGRKLDLFLCAAMKG